MNYDGYSQFTGEKPVRNDTMASVSGSSVYGTTDNNNTLRPQIPNARSDLQTSLYNLSQLHQKMDSLQKFLAESITRNTLLGKDEMDLVSNEISSAIHQIIVNGTTLISGSQSGEGAAVLMPGSGRVVDQAVLNSSPTASGSNHAFIRSSISGKKAVEPTVQMRYQVLEESRGFNQLDFNRNDSNSLLIRSQIAMKAPILFSDFMEEAKPVDFTAVGRWNLSADLQGFGNSTPSGKLKGKIDEMEDENCEIVELEAVELLAEHIHFCEICGKGFKRDANLRMHMRAHGNQFKTPEALAKPDKGIESSKKIRFSCPFVGCNRNKLHKKFRPLKSAVCVKNHFRRSHCPKMYSCNRCNKKSFSVLADLKSHLKHCGESKWKCSCGTTFSRKDKLFGHMALFEGHMPAITEESEKSKGIVAMEEDEETQLEEESVHDGFDQGFFDGLQENFSAIDDGGGDSLNLKDVFGSSPMVGSGLEGWFDI